MQISLLLSMPGGSEWLIILLMLGILYFWIKTLVEIANTQFPDSTTKIVWALIVLFTGIFGALIYILVGRPRRVI